jgi:hypothetical protein
MARETDHFLSFEDEPSAEAIAELLRGQGVPPRVEIQAPVPGLIENIRIVVPKGLEHRARWLLRSADVSDSELNFLATGELKDADNGGSL